MMSTAMYTETMSSSASGSTSPAEANDEVRKKGKPSFFFSLHCSAESN